ncbi:MAG: acetate--CoA ligase family protein [Candidatus Methanosuratincola sp.]
MPKIKDVSRERGWLLEPEAKELCREYGLPVGEWAVVRGPEEAEIEGGRLGYPLAAKIVSPDVVHKSDVGGVALNVDASSVGDVFRRMKAAAEESGYRFEGVLLERMAPPGIETIIGAKRDPQFGPVLMFGLGGIFVEVFKDVSFRVAPIDRGDAEEMISELKAYPVLKGIRGRKPSDIEGIIDALLKVSRMVTELGEVKEIDLNPVIVYEKGSRIVDARMILQTR